MSDNKMQQDLTELACLDLVKKAYWPGTCLFGLENDDKGTLWHLLENCNSNKGTKFPDFIGDQGFIEHFQISSSKTTKRGQEHTKQLNQFKKQSENIINNLNHEEIDIHKPLEIAHITNIMKYPEHSYEYLLESLKSTWDKHLNSLNNYKGPNSIKVFMIQYNDIGALQMYENYPSEIEGMSIGDFPKHRTIDYRFSRDNYILDYLYKYNQIIDYTIFIRYNKYVEIIKISNIPKLKKMNPFTYTIANTCGPMIQSSFTYSKNV